MARGSSGRTAFKQPDDAVWLGKKSVGSAINLLRLDRNLSRQELARKGQLSPGGLGRIERGEVLPRFSTVVRLADALGVPLHELISPSHPALQCVRFPTRSRFPFRDQLLAETGRWLRDYSALEADLGQTLPFAFALGEDLWKDDGPAHVAQAARNAVGLHSEEPIHNLCNLLEENGVKVLSLVKNAPAFFSFSVGPESGGPAVTVNTWDRISVERWIFSAARELGHLLLHPGEYQRGTVEFHPRSESEADAFASSFLMPEAAFDREWEYTRGHPIFFRVVRTKRIFRVSYQTVLHRLVHTGRESPDVWYAFQKQCRRTPGKGFQKNRAREKYASGENGKRTSEPERLSAYDFANCRLKRLVQLALEQERISLERAAEILGLDFDQMKRRRSDWAGKGSRSSFAARSS